MATKVDAALTEINEKLAALAPQLEGLRDFARLNLTQSTQEIILEAIRDYVRRQDRLAAAARELTALVGDGHPDLPVRQIDQVPYANLVDQLTTIQAALAQFTAEERAAALRTSAGAAEPKS